jgi:hypothetical protein
VTSLGDEIDALATGFSGVVSVSRGDEVDFERAYGLADRAHLIDEVEMRLLRSEWTS